MTLVRQTCLAAIVALVAVATPAPGQTLREKVDAGGYDPVTSMKVRYPDEKISDAQRALRDQGYDPGEIDGLHTPQTQQAIAEFQRDHGLIGTGELNAATTAALVGEDAPVAASPRMEDVQSR